MLGGFHALDGRGVFDYSVNGEVVARSVGNDSIVVPGLTASFAPVREPSLPGLVIRRGLARSSKPMNGPPVLRMNLLSPLLVDSVFLCLLD